MLNNRYISIETNHAPTEGATSYTSPHTLHSTSITLDCLGLVVLAGIRHLSYQSLPHFSSSSLSLGERLVDLMKSRNLFSLGESISIAGGSDS